MYRYEYMYEPATKIVTACEAICFISWWAYAPFFHPSITLYYFFCPNYVQ